MIRQTAKYTLVVLLLVVAAAPAMVRCQIFDVNPKHFQGNPACVKLNQTFYSYIDKILKKLNRKNMKTFAFRILNIPIDREN